MNRNGRGRTSSLAAAAAVTLAAGLGVTALLFVAVRALESQKLELSFAQRADTRAAAIRRGLDETVSVLSVTNQLFRTVQPVSRTQFHLFTTPLLERHPFIQALSLQRVMSHAERLAHEASMQAAFPGFRVRELINGALPSAQPRSRYNVVDYLEPMLGNERAFGVDVAANPLISAAIDTMLTTGQPAATNQLQLAQGHDEERGVIMLMPVYQAGMPVDTPEQRRAAWSGATTAVIRTTSLVHTLLHNRALLSDPELLLSVYAGDPTVPANLVYRHGGAGGDEAAGAGAAIERWLAPDGKLHYHKSYLVLDQPWHVTVTQIPQPFLGQHLGSLMTLLGGILFSMLGAALVQTLVQRSRRVQLLVDLRTADLQRSNERLNADIAARKRTELALQDSEQRFRRLLALSSDWYWEQDAQLRFSHITSGFYERGRLVAADYIGKTRWESNPAMLDTPWGRDHQRCQQARLPFSNLEYAIAGSDGVLRWYSTSGEPVYDAAGQFKGYRGTGSEITERKLSEQRIHHIAHHDVLTGLPNRILMQDRLAQATAYANRSGCQLWVLLIDLDRFKFVNDSLGHKAGDLLLQTVAARLQASVRDSDTVARLSGDEFVAILSEYPEHRLSTDIVQRVMRAVAQPVQLGGREFLVTCSIGVAVYDSAGTPVQELIEHADIAMYSAKKLGRNGFQFYQPSMNEATQERLNIEGALRHALERDEFVLHYQPQVDLRSGRIVGMEALLRWRHPELGMVAPARFIALAEETGLIVPIGAWVLRTACAQNRAWQDAGLAPLRVAVNLSARQFSEPGLVGAIAAVLADTALAPGNLELELTESLFMHDVDQAVVLLHELKALGVALSIDDFGTGYSSLSYLRRFPIDVLKIDRSFVNDIVSDADDAAIVASIIALAHNLKLRVIAEGVESRDQLDYLRSSGCDEMQGYYFSRPLPAQQFEQLLRHDTHLNPAADERAGIAH